MTTKRTAAALFLAAVTACAPLTLRAQDAQPTPAAGEAPKIFLDKPAKIVAFQLKRLTNAQLVAVERSPTDKKYAPIYTALLTRKGLEKKYREEAIAGLTAINKSDGVTELLKAFDAVDKADAVTGRELGALLVARPKAELEANRQQLHEPARDAESGAARPAAFAAIAMSGGTKWVEQLATETNGFAPLFRGIALMPDAKLRAEFYPLVKQHLATPKDEETGLAALEAAAYVGNEQEVFATLAAEIQKEDPARRLAAIKSLQRIPAEKWDKAQVEPLAKAVVKLVEQTPADQRTEPASIETIQFGNDLAAAMPPAQGAPLRKQLRELGVRVVLIKAVREQMAYDMRYFAVQAGKPVQLVLENDDAMPHNIVFTQPGAMQEVALAGGAMAPPTDPKAKEFVPRTEKVLEASHLIQAGDTATLSFTAPAQAGEYPYVCTFPGHWVRMYGVMIVVDDLDKYDQSPTVPTDPIQKKPFDSQKTNPLAIEVHHH